MFYDIFEKICLDANTTPAQVRKDLKISQSTMASWKSRGLTPKYGTVKKIADYFGVEWTELVPEEEQAGVIVEHIVTGVCNNPIAPGSAISDQYIDNEKIDKLANKFNFSVLELYPPEQRKAFTDGYWEGWAAKEQELNLTFNYTFSGAELKCVECLSKLNDEGQEKAVDYVQLLAENEKYLK